MHLTIIILTFNLHLVLGLQRSKECPSNFTDVGNSICILLVAQEIDYCGAHSHCELEGKRRGLLLFVPGKHLQNITGFLPPTGIINTGVTGLLTNKFGAEIEWRISDPRYSHLVTQLPNDGIDHTAGNKLSGRVGLVLRYIHGRYETDQQFVNPSTHVLCELSNHMRITMVERFRINWPFKMNPPIAIDTPEIGCFQRLTAKTTIECCLK